MIKIPYCKQEKDYFCGPACLNMILKFYNIDISQRELAKKLKTTQSHGTRNRNIKKIAEKYGFNAKEYKNSSIRQLKELIKKNVPIIVNYLDLEDHEGHLAIVIGYTKSKIILDDPAPHYGKNLSINIKEFNDLWKGGFENKKTKRWMLAITRKN
jgi:ABC-type bacteriocin/lantibiotic exporter with double-glycine peptidase domain